ncbi:cytokine-inducible SH2-containing protein-like [Osmerus mordax]|uniref:cytokine-inducible SH2-containing protein-like n=1 Tax=Osmerus mordax TaxID=8014 RepID=UPI0035103031
MPDFLDSNLITLNGILFVMIVCVQRAIFPVAPKKMVARGMTMQDNGEQRESCYHHPISTLWDPAEDLRCITSTFQYLHTSGWYWGSMSVSEARDALQKVSVGTFLVRDSSHPLYMLTLSVKTDCGPTNVRVEYSCGRFRLDSSSPGIPHLKSFPDILSLIQHYVGSCQKETGQKAEPKENSLPKAKLPPPQPTTMDSPVLLMLKKPLHRTQAFPSLQHLTRLAINRTTDCPAQLPLPCPLVCYLQEYPFRL